MGNLIDSLYGKTRGITLNSQHIELFNILLNNDNRLHELANYLTGFIDEHDKEYIKKVAIKSVKALENDGKIDKDELIKIFSDKNILIKNETDVRNVLEKKRSFRIFK